MWDARLWIEQFENAVDNQNWQGVHSLRREVFFDTVADVQKGYYICQSGKKVEFEDDRRMREHSVLFCDELKVESSQDVDKTTIEVKQLDTMEAARLLENPLVLNMANRHMPGGGVLQGSGAQEEYLFRVSNYFRSLYQFNDIGSTFKVNRRSESYPLDRDYGGVYSPSVTVFRGTEREGYPKLDQPFKVAFVAVPAISGPNLVRASDGLYWLDEPFVEPTKRKIRTIFNIALTFGHANLVLGAFGCGAFANPPNHMARLFDEVLREEAYRNRFGHIIFAILDNHNSYKWFNPSGNFKPFLEVLGRTAATVRS